MPDCLAWSWLSKSSLTSLWSLLHVHTFIYQMLGFYFIWNLAYCSVHPTISHLESSFLTVQAWQNERLSIDWFERQYKWPEVKSKKFVGHLKTGHAQFNWKSATCISKLWIGSFQGGSFTTAGETKTLSTRVAPAANKKAFGYFIQRSLQNKNSSKQSVNLLKAAAYFVSK